MQEIAKALAAAQMEMGKALKQTDNPHFRSKYADLGNVMDACLPALNKHGIAVVQIMQADDFGRSVVTRFIHSSGESIDCAVPLIVGKQDMQGLGSATTYARRYGLMCLAGIAPEDDDGNAAVASVKPHNPAAEGLQDAWKDAVLDSLPADATPRQKAEGFADAICRDFASYKSVKGLDGSWNKRAKIIASFADRFSDLHAQVVDAFETRKMELEGTDVRGIAAE